MHIYYNAYPLSPSKALVLVLNLHWARRNQVHQVQKCVSAIPRSRPRLIASPHHNTAHVLPSYFHRLCVRMFLEPTLKLEIKLHFNTNVFCSSCFKYSTNTCFVVRTRFTVLRKLACKILRTTKANAHIPAYCNCELTNANEFQYRQQLLLNCCFKMICHNVHKEYIE